MTAQLNKRERYLDVIRSKVKAGAVRLTAQLAKMLGLDFADSAELVPRRIGGTPAYSKAATMKIIEEGRRMATFRVAQDVVYGRP